MNEQELKLEDGRTVKLRVRSPESYTPNLRNTNQGSERGKAALDDSLQTCGFHRGIVVSADDTVVNGNHAYQSASERGVVKSWIEIEVEGDVGVVTKRVDWADAQDPKAIAAAISDNRTSELNYTIDPEAFQQSLDALLEAGVELPNSIFTQEELEAIAGMGDDEDYEGLTDEDEIPDEEQVETRVKRGEVWQLGRHRIMCGDSTCKADVEKLMDGTIADMVFTDPPYNINFKPQRGTHEAIENDNMEAEDFKAWLSDVFNLVCQNQKNDSFSIVWCSWSTIEQFHPVLKKMYDVKSLHIWVKNNFGIGYYSRPKYEPFFLLLKGSPPVPQKAPSDVWDFAKVHKTIHSCEKPVGLIEEIFGYYSQLKNLVFDPFLGSGSTLIACEKTDRTCYGMEISEKYCDVILQRFQDFTGIEPQRIN